MKQRYFFSLVFMILTASGLSGYAQQQGAAQQAGSQAVPNPIARQHGRLVQHYRTMLQVDSAKAEQVAQVQDSYKQGLRGVMADSTLTIVDKQAKVKLLMTAKNQQLRALLSPAQQEKVIPTTEREQQQSPAGNSSAQ